MGSGRGGDGRQAAPPRRPKRVPRPSRQRRRRPRRRIRTLARRSALPERGDPRRHPAPSVGGAAAGLRAAIRGRPLPRSPPAPRGPSAVPEDSGPALTGSTRSPSRPPRRQGRDSLGEWGTGFGLQAGPARGNTARDVTTSGIRRQFAKARLVVGTPEVLQIRTGLHAGAGGSELHVVLDLAHPNVTVTQVATGPHRLRIHLQRK